MCPGVQACWARKKNFLKPADRCGLRENLEWKCIATGFESLQSTVDQSGPIFSHLYGTCKFSDHSPNSKNSKGFKSQVYLICVVRSAKH